MVLNMKRETHTAERIREVFDYLPESGTLVWKHKTGRRVVIGSTAGHITPFGYISVAVDRIKYQAHRLIWLHQYGCWPSGDVDHINGNRSDNRLENLRDVSRRVNLQNRRDAMHKSASGLLGVTFRPNRKSKWVAEIVVDGVKKYIGAYSTKEEAHAAYISFKRVVHPGCVI